MRLPTGAEVPVVMGPGREVEWRKLRDALGLVDVGDQPPFVAGPGMWPSAFGIPGAPHGFRCIAGGPVRVFALWGTFRAFVWDGASVAFCDGTTATTLVDGVLCTMEARDRRDGRRGRAAPASREEVKTKFEQAKSWMEANQ